MTEDIAEAIKEMGDWNEAALLDRIVVWDRWIEKGIAPDGTKEARDAATQIIIERANRLRAERDRLTDALKKIGGITMSMCFNSKHMAETQRDIARIALKETDHD